VVRRERGEGVGWRERDGIALSPVSGRLMCVTGR
jgi:hypothetical protein